MEQLARYGLLTARIRIAGFAADSSLAGCDNPRWGRRVTAVLAMLTGAIAGTSMLAYSVAVPLFVCGVMAEICALARLRLSRKELTNG